MDVLKRALFYSCVITFIGECICGGCNNDLIDKSAAVRLSNDLFCSYNKNIRPVMNQSTQINVNTTFYFFSFHMDDQWDVLQIVVQLIMTWKDEFLIWDPTKYDNLKEVFEDSTKLWIPDVVSYDVGFNGDTNAVSYYLPESMVKINRNGVVRYNHRLILNAKCTANLMKWPFDSHNCIFYIGSPIYTDMYVNYTITSGYQNQLTYFQQDREWEMKSIETGCQWLFINLNYSHCVLKYNISVKRYSSMYYSSVVIPGIVISLMRTFTYLMGHRTSLRIILLCLFFISELFYIQILDMKIPNNGNNAVFIVLLYRNSLILTAMAIVISVINNELYNRCIKDPRNGPEWLKSIMRYILNHIPITLFTNLNTQGAELLIERNVEDDIQNRQSDENPLFWKILSILLDYLFFMITLIISLFNFLLLIP